MSSWSFWLSLMMMMMLGTQADPFAQTPEPGWKQSLSGCGAGSSLWMEPPKPAPQRALADAFGLRIEACNGTSWEGLKEELCRTEAKAESSGVSSGR